MTRRRRLHAIVLLLSAATGCGYSLQGLSSVLPPEIEVIALVDRDGRALRIDPVR